jgi:proteic killer suppression protein
LIVIKSFRDAETEKVWCRTFSRKLPREIQRIAKRKLDLIEAAGKLDDLRVPPGNRLEALAGSRRGQHSIRINDQWRICFRWEDGDAYEVEIVDYH